MTEGGESTPHLTAAREHLHAFLVELREARHHGEADATALAQYAHVGRGLDFALEGLEIRP